MTYIGFSMVALYNHSLIINRITISFETIAPSTSLYPHIKCPPSIQDYLIPVSESEPFVFYAGLGLGANRLPINPPLVGPFSSSPTPASNTSIRVTPTPILVYDSLQSVPALAYIGTCVLTTHFITPDGVPLRILPTQHDESVFDIRIVLRANPSK